jgi:glycyl-tRNA synthetase
MFNKNDLELKTIVEFSKRKGFVFPSSEIYGGFAATYDFGPLGMMLKKNIEAAWRNYNVISRTDVVEIEGAIFMHPKVWEASGHIGSFTDLLIDDVVTKKRYRADHLIEDAGIMENAGMLTTDEVDKIVLEKNLMSPEGNLLGKAKKFNLLVSTHLGPVEDETSIAYLKGESCQNIYLNWKSVQETTRRKLPFGIAQIGKAFRNEITVKQFLFRTREFEQMDVQYFVKPGQEDKWFIFWKEYTYNFYNKILGFSTENLKWRQHEETERAFYAKDAWDIEYRYGKLGSKEMCGVHNRTSYDTDQHSKFSGQDLSYFDVADNVRHNPYIVEVSAGFTRAFLACMYEYYFEEEFGLEDKKDTRVVFKLPLNLAPFKIALLPLMKKDGLAEKAFEIHQNLRKMGIMSDYDETGSIGKRYRRQDENGTPYCVCVDYDSLSNGTVTVRDRDTMEQKLVKIEELPSLLTIKY